jgi:isochorismate synthase
LEEIGMAMEERFKNNVRQAIAAIKAGELTKIVLSRTKTLKHGEDFDPFQAFQKLHRSYPSAFVSLVSLPEQNEMWLGATPETLVSVDTEGIFRTTSLAGTQVAKQPNGQEEEIKDIRWGQKEIHEQALVSRYIVECFKKIRLREYCESGPKTVKAGNLYHLRTDFVVDTHEVNFPELGTVMLRLLHPTSAVCGTPKEAALHFISEKEAYDRSFYSGYLGPVQVDQESALFVNLRTLRLSDGVATLYAGAGITEDSDPEREWEETEMKCETLLRVLI